MGLRLWGTPECGVGCKVCRMEKNVQRVSKYPRKMLVLGKLLERIVTGRHELLREVCRNSFEKGKIIGRRNTFWDGVFLVINRRYDNGMEMVANLAFYLVANMTAAMFMMFWFFTFGLPSLIWSLGGSAVRPVQTLRFCFIQFVGQITSSDVFFSKFNIF